MLLANAYQQIVLMSKDNLVLPNCESLKYVVDHFSLSLLSEILFIEIYTEIIQCFYFMINNFSETKNLVFTKIP